CLPHEPVRTAVARNLRAAAWLTRVDSAGGDGQPARRSVAVRRAALGSGAGVSAGEAASVRQVHRAARTEDGTPHGARALCGGGPPPGGRRAARPRTKKPGTLKTRNLNLRPCDSRFRLARGPVTTRGR